MQKRKLGDNLEVSAIGLGCMGLIFGVGPAAKNSEASRCSIPPRATARKFDLLIGGRGASNKRPRHCQCGL